MQTLCESIGPIKIINTGHVRLKPAEQMRFMLSQSFWSLFTGARVLLYDADSLIIPITDMSYDYAGQGGLTLRNPAAMLACLRYVTRNTTLEDRFFKETLVSRGLGHVGPPIGLWQPWTYPPEIWKDPLLRLVGKRFDLNANIKIYILCHNQERFEEAAAIYAPYKWAYPIVMKYQDTSFENAFWPQLQEIADEWSASEFVGTMSFTAYRKVNLAQINKQIIEGEYCTKNYVYFLDTQRKVLTNKTDHPYFTKIWKDLLATLSISDVNETWCNYFMCTPRLMEKFIVWHRNVLTPAVLAHPLIYEDSEYKGALTEEDLIKLWGKPYYPMVPFVMERMNRAFFTGK
jgi:hypothetical protein